MPVQNPIIVPYTKKSVEAQSVNLAAKSSSVQRQETYTGDFTYEIWHARLKQALKWRQENYDEDWRRAYRMYNGAHWRDVQETNPSSDAVRERITVNHTMSTVLNMVPFLMASKPQFICKPRKPETVKSADLQSKILNYEYEQREMNVQVKKAVYDHCIIGHGIVKVSYVLELDKPKKAKDGDLEMASYVKADAPNVKRICPFYFLIDPCAEENNLETASWCAEILFKPLRDVLANQRYNQSVINKIKRGIYDPGTKSTVFDNINDPYISNIVGDKNLNKFPDSDLVVLYEVWSKRYKKYFVFADGVPEPLLEKDWPFDYIDNFPFIKLDYIPIQDDLYGVGIPYSIEDQQLELNRIRTGQFEHRRRAKRIFMALKGQLDTPEANKLTNAEDLSVVFENVANAVRVLEQASYPEDNYIAEANIKQDFLDLTGQDSLVSGGRLPSRTTGVEVNSRNSLFRLKLEDRVDGVDRFVIKVGVQVLQHIKANFDVERLIGVFGKQGVNWETLTPEMIKEEVDVSMESIAAPKVDPMIDRQQRSFVWQTTLQGLPLIQAGILRVDPNKVFEWMIKAFGYEDVGEFFMDALLVTPPLQQQVAGQNGTQPQQQINLLSQGQPSPITSDISQQNGLAVFGGF